MRIESALGREWTYAGRIKIGGYSVSASWISRILIAATAYRAWPQRNQNMETIHFCRLQPLERRSPDRQRSAWSGTDRSPVEWGHDPSRISQYWSVAGKRCSISGNTRRQQLKQVNFSMIHNLSNAHLPVRGFCFESIIKRCLMIVNFFCHPQPLEIVINRRQCHDCWKHVFKYDGKYEVMNRQSWFDTSQSDKMV